MGALSERECCTFIQILPTMDKGEVAEFHLWWVVVEVLLCCYCCSVVSSKCTEQQWEPRLQRWNWLPGHRDHHHINTQWGSSRKLGHPLSAFCYILLLNIQPHTLLKRNKWYCMNNYKAKQTVLVQTNMYFFLLLAWWNMYTNGYVFLVWQVWNWHFLRLFY